MVCACLLTRVLFVYAQGDNGDEDLAPTEVDGQFEFQAKDNIPPGGFKIWKETKLYILSAICEKIDNWVTKIRE